MLNRLLAIKLVHTIIFFFMWVCLAHVLYCSITKTYNWALLLALSTILIEGLALIFNHWQCPMSTLARKYGDEKGSVTDIFLPAWYTRHVFQISSVLFAGGLVLLDLGHFFQWP
jgi:hypothetical protein